MQPWPAPITLITGYCKIYNDSYSLYKSSRLECSCGGGSHGNPYLLQGCRDINECENPDSCPAGQVCTNYPNGWGCSPQETTKSRVNVIFVGSVLGLIFLLIGAWWLHKLLKKRKRIKLKKKFFEQNEGLLLEQQLSSNLQQNHEEVEYVRNEEICPWDVAFRSALDGGTASSMDLLPLLSNG